MAHDVFISHSSKDKTIADAVCAGLETVKIRCWIAPRDILPGEKWATAITKAIESSRIMVLIFSSHSNNSEDVLNELLIARDSGAIIIPLKLGGILPKGDMQYYLKRTHWLHAMNLPTEKQIQELVETVSRFLKDESKGSIDRSNIIFNEVKDKTEHSILDLKGDSLKKSKFGKPKMHWQFIIAIIALIAVGAVIMFTGSQQPQKFELLAPQPILDQKTFINSISMEFVLIPAGEFNMGSPENEKDRQSDEGPVHNVNFSKAFYVGKYEVTQKQWHDIMGNNPSLFKGDHLPVEQVSWDDTQEFIKKLNEKESTNKYRLLSEAEWEYSARSGTTTISSFGDDESMIGEYGWYDANCESEIHEVGQKKSNPWGLYDMYGNVWEWVHDTYRSSYDGAPNDGSAWEGSGSFRVGRGGSKFNSAGIYRSALRLRLVLSAHSADLGFRIVRDL